MSSNPKRGFCGGGAGCFGAGGMDMCIALRTAVPKDRKPCIRAGDGILRDSGPEAEWIETASKAGVPGRAAGGARVQAPHARARHGQDGMRLGFSGSVRARRRRCAMNGRPVSLSRVAA